MLSVLMLIFGGLLTSVAVELGETDPDIDPVNDGLGQESEDPDPEPDIDPVNDGLGQEGEDPDPEIVDVADFPNRFNVDGTEGTVVGTEEADEIIIEASPEGIGGYFEFGESYVAFYDARTDPIEINAGAGDDLIVVESGNAIISTGDGNDTVDASKMTSGMIEAEEGDLVIGSDIESSTGIGVSANGAVFKGGSSGELAVGKGEGTQLFGGGGNDHLVAFGGDVLLDGGEGDDVLRGNASANQFCQCTHVTNTGERSNDSSDTLFGGDGDDTLYLSQGDTGSGGNGADQFRIIANISSTEAATVTDFSPSEDTLLVQVWGGHTWDYTDSSYDLTDRITQIVEDGTTTVLVDGTVAANIEGITELSIGYPDPDDLGNFPTLYVNSETGEYRDASDFDIIISVLRAQ